MKSFFGKITPFLILFLLPLSAALVSCVTNSMNIKKGQNDGWINFGNEKSEDGKLYLPEYMDKIDNLYLLDIDKKKKRKTVSTDLWRYNPETSELQIDLDIKENEIIRVEGKYSNPRRFKLIDFDFDKKQFYLIIDERIADEKDDFTIDEKTASIIFNKSVDPGKARYIFSYKRKNGGVSCYGDAINNQNIQYLISLATRRLYDKDFISYRLVKDKNGEFKIVEVNEKLKDSDLDFYNKDCSKMSDIAISKEVGFNVRSPLVLGKKYKKLWKSICETTDGKYVSDYYQNDHDRNDYLNIMFLKNNEYNSYKSRSFHESEKDLLIEEKVITISGAKVMRTIYHALDMYEKTERSDPKIIKMLGYHCEDKDRVIIIDMIFKDQSTCTEIENIIKEIIESKNKIL